MKLQGHPQEDDSILGENFEAKSRKPLWMQRLLASPEHTQISWIQRSLIAGVLWLLVCTTIYMAVMIGYGPAFQRVAGIDNPLSAVRDVARTRQNVRGFEAEYVENMQKVQTALAQLAQLRSTHSLDTNPTLLAVQSVRETRVAWNLVLADIDGAIKKTVQSNDIIQRIVIGSINLVESTGQGSISNVKVYANGEQSSLTLASRFLEELETSTSLKDVKSSNPTTQQETASGAILTYTPLDITFTLQKEQEVTTNDADRSVRDVQEDLMKLLPR